MSDDELNAIIDETLFGNRRVKHTRVRINGRWMDIETWLPDKDSPDDPSGGTYAGQKPPRHADIVRWYRKNPPPV
jgi:hypothetical protein